MRLKVVLAFLFSISAHAALPYQDEDFSCVPEADGRRYAEDFSIDLDAFGGFELCDNAHDTKKLFNDLSLIERTKFEGERGHPFARGLVSRDEYYDWMKRETRGVTRGHDLPFNTAYNSWGYFTMQDGWAALSTLGRVGTIIHEARHTAGHLHRPCEHGPYAGSRVPGCDGSLAEGGAHAVELEYYARVVVEAENLHPVYQSMARLMALGRANFVFNRTPLHTREGLLAESEGRLLLVDGDTVTERLRPARLPKGAKLKRTSFGASYVLGARAWSLDLYDAATAPERKRDDYSYFKQFLIKRETWPESFRDVEELDLGNRRFLAVLDDAGRAHSFDFPEGGWHAPVAAPESSRRWATVAPDGTRGLFAVSEGGMINPFDPAAPAFAAPLATRWPEGVRSYAYLGPQLLALSAEGRVSDARSGAPVCPLPGPVSDMVNIPLYDAFEVAP